MHLPDREERGESESLSSSSYSLVQYQRLLI